MKKPIRIAGGLLAGLIVIILIAGLVAPKQLDIRTRQRIAADKQQVFDQLRYRRNFPTWSPRLEQDPGQNTG